MAKVLILGGTGIARALSALVAGQPGLEGMISMAGRTARPAAQPLPVHRGGFGGAAGLEKFLVSEKINALVDATHPYARQISANAARAATAAEVPRLCLVRPPWNASDGDDWHQVADEARAAGALPDGARAFLALGAGRLEAFFELFSVWRLVRVVDPPREPLLLGPHRIIVGRGPFSLDDEAALLARHRISHIVCRNSGTRGARAKLDAARAARIRVIMIAPPELPEPRVGDPQAAMDWLLTTLE